MADLDNKLVTFASLKETVTRLKEYANQFEPRKEVISKAKLTYSTNYIRAYCDYVATIPATVRVTDDDGSVLLVTGSANGSWRAVRLIKGETDRFHKVYYKDGYVYIQVDNDSMYTVFGGVLLKVFGSATGTEIQIENAADTDIEIPTSYPANAIGYVNDTIGSTNVDDALNTVIAELHTHDNKEVLDLLSENEEGKLQYNGVIIGGEGGASTADAVTYENAGVDTEIDNVKEALDKLFNKVYYVAPQITSFTMTPSTTVYEVGQTVNSLVFNWTTNKDIASQTLTDCVLTDETVRTATYNTLLSANKTFTLSINDGENTSNKSLSIAFRHKFYWGNATLPDTFDSAFILGLPKSQFATGKTGTYSMTLGTDEYGFLAYPVSFGTIEVVNIGGFDTEVVDCGTIDFTNASGNTTAFKIYRTGRSGLGSISPVIK